MALSKIQGLQTITTNDNIIVNGAMLVDQRNQTVTNGDQATGDNKYLADRFENIFQDGDSTTRIDTSSVSIGDHPEEFTKAAKVVCSAVDDLSDATSVYYNIRYNSIEQRDLRRFNFGTSSAKKLVLSFWVKSGVTGTFFITFQQDNGTNFIRYHSPYTISSANTWEKKTVIMTAPGTGLNWVQNHTSDGGMRVMFHLACSSDRLDNTINTWFEDTTNSQQIRCGTGQTNFFLTADAEFYLTGVKLEEGSVVTPFQHESYSDVLRKCQRYYNRLGYMKHQFYSSSANSSNPDLVDTITFPPMRAAPAANPYTDANYSSSGSGGTSSTTLTLADIGISSLSSSAQRSSTGAANVRTTYYLELNAEI